MQIYLFIFLPSPLTDERCDDVVHALQEAGQVLGGGVVGWRDLGHHGRSLGPGSLHAALIGQDVCQAQDPVHLQVGHKHTWLGQWKGAALCVFQQHMIIFVAQSRNCYPELKNLAFIKCDLKEINLT